MKKTISLGLGVLLELSTSTAYALADECLIGAQRYEIIICGTLNRVYFYPVSEQGLPSAVPIFVCHCGIYKDYV